MMGVVFLTDGIQKWIHDDTNWQLNIVRTANKQKGPINVIRKSKLWQPPGAVIEWALLFICNVSRQVEQLIRKE